MATVSAASGGGGAVHGSFCWWRWRLRRRRSSPWTRCSPTHLPYDSHGLTRRAATASASQYSSSIIRIAVARSFKVHQIMLVGPY